MPVQQTMANQQQTSSVKSELTQEQRQRQQQQQQQPVASVNLMMTGKDKELLEKWRPELLKNIGINDGMLVAQFRARGGLTKYAEEQIQSRPDTVGSLLDLLQKGDSNTMDKFIYSLRETGQRHVADKWLRPPRQPDNWVETDSTGCSASSFLSDSDANMLERYRPHIMSELTLDAEFLGQLRAWEVLTDTEEAYIKGITGNSNAVGHLIDKLLCKTPDSLEEFLHALNRTGRSFLVVKYLRQPTLPDTVNFVRGGDSTKELEEALRYNLKQKLNHWKTALDAGMSSQDQKSISDHGRQWAYIDQGCSILKSSSEDVPRTIKLVERSSPGDRIIIYGEAGMGKTTLLKELTRSWIMKDNSELIEKFRFVFLIPLRLTGRGSLLNIVCDELELIPSSNQERLKQSLELNEREVLFLLDSFEELRRDVVKAEKAEINALITGWLYPNSTVIVTSRPSSKLEQFKARVQAKLKDLPGEKVKQIIQQQFSENTIAVDKLLRAFPAMPFLQRPINLALFLFVVRNDKQAKEFATFTQTGLLNQVVQYLMLAYAKKRDFGEFTPMSGSYLQNDDIPSELRRLMRDIAEKCYEGWRENDVILYVQNDRERKDYVALGLFTEGSEINSVVLPHQLFQEYLAAVHLAEDQKTWKALFEEIKQKSESGPERPTLIDVVRPIRLDNVVRFLVAMSPEVRAQIGSLFLVERVRSTDCEIYRLVNFEYYTELIRDCSDEKEQSVLVPALLNAPIRETHNTGQPDNGAIVLLSYLNYHQRVTFLKKMLNLDLCIQDGRPTLSCGDGSHNLKVTGNFVEPFADLVYFHDCIIKTNELYIRKNSLHRFNLPASMLSRNFTHVLQLKLEDCALVQGIPNYMARVGTSALQHSAPCRDSSLLERIELCYVEGLEHCDVITMRQCQLVVKHSYVRVSALKICFPNLSHLELEKTTTVYQSEDELKLWLSTVQNVKGMLSLAPLNEGQATSLSHLLDILAENKGGFKYLKLSRCTLLLNRRHGHINGTVKVNNTLRRLEFQSCKGNEALDLGQLLDVCNQCSQLEEVWVWKSNLVFDDEKVESTNHLSGLKEFRLRSPVHTPAGRRLAEQEITHHLRRLCPSAKVFVWKP